MGSYWIRHRLCFTVVFCAVLAVIVGLLFVFPVISQEAEIYNAQSIYNNSDVDFIVPEPSFEQVGALPGTQGIEKVFPYYLTNADLTVKGKTMSETVLLSDQFLNQEITMYNDKRLISKSDIEFDNPILADWKFCHDTSAGIGDTVTFSIGDEVQEYRIYAIYETNSVFGSALLAPISEEQKKLISVQSDSHGYSAMLVTANDYSVCRSYLITDYRPLGRLRSRDEFDDEEKYKIHESAILSGDYSNEITDFRVSESTLKKAGNSYLLWLGAALVILAILAYNITMAKRGVEEPYFTRHCIPRGQSVKEYYIISFITETILSIIILVAVQIIKKESSDIYITNAFGGLKSAIVPVVIVITEIICLYMNCSRIRAGGATGRVTIPLNVDSVCSDSEAKEKSEKKNDEVQSKDLPSENPQVDDSVLSAGHDENGMKDDIK